MTQKKSIVADATAELDRLKIDDETIAAMTVFCEARGETETGRRGVSAVIHKRANGGSLRAVCLKPWQFSCWNNDDPNWRKAIARFNIGDRFGEYLRAVRHPLELPSTHYYNPRVCNPSWAHNRRWRVDAIIGSHVFGHFAAS